MSPWQTKVLGTQLPSETGTIIIEENISFEKEL